LDEKVMKTLEELERIRKAGPDLLEALEAIVEGFQGSHPDPGHTWTPMTKYEAREIARAAIEKVKSW
jgi:hypothetical protein